MITQRIIEVAGQQVEVINFGYASYYYPVFNGNAEFPVTAKGFRNLSHYIRTINWFSKLINL